LEFFRGKRLLLPIWRFLECEAGDKAKARRTLEQLEEFDPDSPLVDRFLDTGEYQNQSCKLQ
jgi:hypothetical protein